MGKVALFITISLLLSLNGYASTFDIYKATIISEEPFQYNIQRLTDSGDIGKNSYQPSIDSSGNKIAFFSDETGRYEVYVINSDGTNRQQLTFSEPGYSQAPRISADGSMIAFIYSNDREIYVIKPDGTGLRQVSVNADHGYGSAISGDGSIVAYTSNGNLFAVNSDGTNNTQLTNLDGVEWQPAIDGDG